MHLEAKRESEQALQATQVANSAQVTEKFWELPNLSATLPTSTKPPTNLHNLLQGNFKIVTTHEPRAQTGVGPLHGWRREMTIDSFTLVVKYKSGAQ